MPAKYDKQHLFFTVFIILNLVFAFYQFSFFWGNHDWDWIKGTTQVLSLNTGLFEGRYAKFILNVLLYNGQILPFLNTFTAFALLSLGAVLLVMYWQIGNKTDRIIVALLPTIAPFILGWLYFPINLLGNFAAVALVAGGLLLTERCGVGAKFAAIACFVLGLGIYPSVMEMMMICFCFRYIMQPPEQRRIMFSTLGVMLAAVAIFKILLIILTAKGIIYAGHYNMQTASIAEVMRRIPQTISLIFSQMWETLPFFPLPLKICGITLVVLSMVIVIKNKQKLLLWTIALSATVFSAFIAASAENVAYMPRINFYGLNFFYAGAAAVALQQKQLYRNIAYAASLLFIYISVQQDIYAQKVWNLGKNAEQQIVECITLRVEERNPKLPLIPVIAGEITLRPRYYAEDYRRSSPYILNNSFLIRHIPSGMYNFYAPQIVFHTQAQIGNMTPELYHWLQNAVRSWPADEGLWVDDTYAVILLTPRGIREIKAQLPH